LVRKKQSKAAVEPPLKATVDVEVPTSLKEQLEALAQERGLTLTRECIEAFKAHLSKHGRWPLKLGGDEAEAS
jgi:hypothetical protein